MDDAVLDGDIGRGDLGPFLRLQLGQKLVADRAIIGFGRRSARSLTVIARARTRFALLTIPTSLPSRRTGTRLIRLVSSKTAISATGVVLGDRDDVARHDVLHPAAMRLQVFSGELVGRRHHFEPPRAPPLGSGFGAMQQIPFADHADHPVVLIDNRHRAYAVLGHQFCDRLHGRILVDRNHLARHHVHSAHHNPSS